MLLVDMRERWALLAIQEVVASRDREVAMCSGECPQLLLV